MPERRPSLKGFGLQPVSQSQLRIIIDVDPLTGGSTMRVLGGLNQIAVALTLSNQLNVLLPNMFKEVFQAASGLVTAGGTPVAPQVPNTMEIKTEPEGEPA